MMKKLTALGFPTDIPSFRICLLWLVAIDTAFIAGHLVGRFGEGVDLWARLPTALNIISDDGLPEMFSHLKWAVVVLCLIALYVMSRIPLFAAMAVIYLIVLADDRLGIHEAGGEFLGAQVPLLGQLGMAPHQAGELVIWAGLGLIIIAVAAIGYFKTTREQRGVGKPFVLAFAGCMLFAIGLDTAQEPLRNIPDEAVSFWTRYGLQLIEDGGEMYMTSLNAAVAIATFIGYRARMPLPGFTYQPTAQYN